MAEPTGHKFGLQPIRFPIIFKILEFLLENLQTFLLLLFYNIYITKTNPHNEIEDAESHTVHAIL